MGRNVERGEYITSLSRLSKDLSISVRQVRTALKRLEKTNEIDTVTTNKYTKISICKYDSYQVDESVKKKAETKKRQAKVESQSQDLAKNLIKSKGNNEKFFKECLDSVAWLEVMCMQNKIDNKVLEKALKVFNNHLLAIDENKKNLKEYKKHFVNWLKYNVKDLKQENTSNLVWKWKGQAERRGTMSEMTKDKVMFDKPGFDFKIIENGN